LLVDFFLNNCEQTSDVKVAIEIISVPAVGVESIAEIGSSLHENMAIKKTEGGKSASLYISKDAQCKLPFVGSIIFKNGELLTPDGTKNGQYSFKVNSSIKVSDSYSPSNANSRILIPKNPPYFRPTYYMGSLFSFDKIECNDLTVEVRQDFTGDARAAVEYPSFKRELIYNGVLKNVISLTYHEYARNGDSWLLRPGFSQDLKFDISENDIIGYKGSRFQIIKAGNVDLVYKVIKGLTL
jgi:hypothetical protein